MGNLNFKVLLLDTKKSNPNHYICVAILQALRVSPLVESVIKADAHNAIQKAAANECNLLFVFDGEELDRELCRRLATVCGYSVLWVTEDPYEISINVANAELFDLVFTNDSASVSRYGAKGRHLPLAGAKNFHFHPIVEFDRLRYDFFFAGTAWPNRVEFFRDIFEDQRQLEIGRRAKIALPTNPHLPPVDIGIPASQLSWRTSPIDFGRFVNSSLATVLLPRVFSASGNNEFAETPPPRLFEAALAGGVQLVQERLEEVSNYFVPGKEFLYFSDARDFLDKIKTLQNEPDMRAEIARAAQAAALAKHCYEHRVREVLKAVCDAKKERGTATTVPSRSSPSVLKPRLLFVTHNLVKNGNFGGVEVHVEQISEQLREYYEVYFYAPKEKADSTRTVLTDITGALIDEFKFSGPTSPWLNSCDEREAAFAKMLCKHRIQVVHFHHLIGHAPSLVHIAKSIGVATALTVHDYYAVCHNFTLLSFKGQYCRPEQTPLSQCDTCLWHSHHVLPGSQASRRAFWNGVLASVDLLAFNTQGALDLMSSIYPSVLSHKNAQILPVPIDESKFLRRRQSRDNDDLAPVKVAILGNFTHHKGGSVIARAIPFFENVNVEFHIFGSVAAGFEWLGKEEKKPKVVVHGAYSPHKLPLELAQCDVSLHLSIWPETYCLTLSEAWQTGLVPIVSDIGALGERVIHGVNGLKIPVDSEGHLIQAIRMLVEGRKLLASLKRGVEGAPISLLEKHCEDLRRAYATIEIASLRYLPGTKDDSQPITLRGVGLYVGKNNWAETAGMKSGALRPAFSGLILKALRHYRHHGIRSTAKESMRFLRSRI